MEVVEVFIIFGLGVVVGMYLVSQIDKRL